jgi:uncharacterized tellurite resistance protein B-like protein
MCEAMSLLERVKGLVSTSRTVGAATPREPLSAREHDAMVELAFLVMAADGVLRSEEIEAFSGVVEGLRTLRSPSKHDVGGSSAAELLERLSARAIGPDLDDQLREVVSRLSTEDSRRLAYRIAVMLSLVDHEVSDGEFQLELTLIDALELSNAEAEGLAAEAKRALLE